MARVRGIFQPLIADQVHAPELVALISSPWADRITVSSAYANAAGIDQILEALRAVGERATVFIGVRNGSTTAQAFVSVLKTGARLFAVDTGMRGRIFHSKLSIASSDSSALVLIGSANVTHSGLFNNIESSTITELDLADVDDLAVLDVFHSGFERLIDDFPDHCFQVTSLRQVVELIKDGTLEDERAPVARSAIGVSTTSAPYHRQRIALPFRVPPRRASRRPRSAPVATMAGKIVSVMPHFGQLLWAKPNLPRGDLQLLEQGHGSGVLRLTQAAFEVAGSRIDQTRYFRNVAFAGLGWQVDPVDPEKEVSTVPVSLIIVGVYLGDYDLRLSHKPAWEAGQGNYTTGLHWDGATAQIRNASLVGRTLRLYAPPLEEGRFVIEID